MVKEVFDAVLCIEVLNNNGDVISSGTGFVYDKDDKYGYVLTNAHVVSSGSNVQATLSNEKSVNLTILGTDTYTDLAVLRMDVKDVLQVASIGDSKNTAIGLLGSIPTMRGKILHDGDRNLLTREETSAMQLLEMVVYAQILKRAQLKDKEISKIIRFNFELEGGNYTFLTPD